MASFVQDNAQLLQSITEADNKTLKAALIAMCKSSPECLAEASKHFLTSKDVAYAGESSEDEDEDADEKSDAAHRRKRQKNIHDAAPALVSRYRTCSECKQVFDVTQNYDEACRTHDGEKEIDTSFFPDDDEIELGHYIDPDTDWRVESCPEGFPWTCCDKPADDPGCIVGRHMSYV